MHVTYAPEDGDRQEWDFVAGRVRSGEAALMQTRFGATWEQFDAGVQKGDIHARRVLLWHLLRLEHVKLRFEDTPDFYADELLVEFSVTELTRIIDELTTARMPEDQRAMVLAAFDRELAKAVLREGGMGNPDPKATPVDSGTATG